MNRESSAGCVHAASTRGSTISQAPTDAKPKNSKQARVMTPDVSRTIPEASRATQPLEATRNTRVKPGMPRLHATKPASAITTGNAASTDTVYSGGRLAAT